MTSRNDIRRKTYSDRDSGNESDKQSAEPKAKKVKSLSLSTIIQGHIETKNAESLSSKQEDTLPNSIQASVIPDKVGQERQKALTESSKAFMSEQEISSKIDKLSNIAHEIPQSLLFDTIRRKGTKSKTPTKITYDIITEYRKINNKSKGKSAFELGNKIDILEAYTAIPTQLINNNHPAYASRKKEIGPVLIDAHRLLTDLLPDWEQRFPQLVNLHTHIDTELKKLHDQA